MINRAKEIYEAASKYAFKCGSPSDNFEPTYMRDFIWLAQCTDAERAEALRMLDSRAAGRSM